MPTKFVKDIKIKKLFQKYFPIWYSNWQEKIFIWYKTFEQTRRLVNVRSHMMFRPELIYIFDLTVNQMKR